MSDESSIVWHFFMKSNDLTRVNCRRCQKSLKFSGSTLGMIHHVRTIHADELKTLIRFRFVSNESSRKETKIDGLFFSKYIESKRESTSLQTTKNEIVSFEALLVSARPPISSSPLSFWEINRNRFPKLSMLARHVLCSPQSSAQVERLFSKCGQIVSSTRRNRLSTETLNDLLLNAILADSKIQEEDDSSDDEEADLQEDFSGMWPTTKKRRQSSVPRSVRYD
ncbi:unnamed protein product [Caenorhabditis nigoni]|uniref:BED-type domain-containing protein n=1 Tax=Caenorhabditis nigoni TaxID=1611254 RepID=A0A2G5V195_9PELO|nr:hypothetical protein B9Z55_005343 [Caenorhabditis nigoni]PIC53322.1 hypothetical protein B9Z55_003074 [Caenorhabditis nigoni]